MNNVMQFIGTFASIFSIPLAIILYLKTKDARQNKIRQDIIRSLSYRIGEGKPLDKKEVAAVYNSKIREHNIKKPIFTEVSILEDIIADAVSNPFLVSEQKTLIINNIDSILEKYGAQNYHTQTISKPKNAEHYTRYSESKYESETYVNKKREMTRVFTYIATILSAAIALVTFFTKDAFTLVFDNVKFPTEVFISLAVAIIATVLTSIIYIIAKKQKK